MSFPSYYLQLAKAKKDVDSCTCAESWSPPFNTKNLTENFICYLQACSLEWCWWYLVCPFVLQIKLNSITCQINVKRRKSLLSQENGSHMSHGPIPSSVGEVSLKRAVNLICRSLTTFYLAYNVCAWNSWKLSKIGRRQKLLCYSMHRVPRTMCGYTCLAWTTGSPRKGWATCAWTRLDTVSLCAIARKSCLICVSWIHAESNFMRTQTFFSFDRPWMERDSFLALVSTGETRKTDALTV